MDECPDTARIATLEAWQESFQGDLKQLDRTVSRLAEEVRTGFRKAGEASRTSWPTLAAWASVIILMGTMALTPIAWLATSNWEILFRHITNPKLHATILSEVRALEKAQAEMDIKIQQEVKAGDIRVHALMEEMDRRLQSEMRLLDAVLAERIEGNEP